MAGIISETITAIACDVLARAEVPNIYLKDAKKSGPIYWPSYRFEATAKQQYRIVKPAELPVKHSDGLPCPNLMFPIMALGLVNLRRDDSRCGSKAANLGHIAPILKVMYLTDSAFRLPIIKP